MNQDFVPYGLALKLKELGFNEECIAYYDLRNDLEFYGGDNLKDTHCVQLNTPLFQQAFRWFRNKYKINSCISHETPNRETYYEVVISEFTYNNLFDTYEEAEIYCLEKLIDIVELNNNNDEKK
jgi:hypothetical protein